MDGFDHATAQAAQHAFDNGQMVPTGNDSTYGVEFYIGKVPNFDGTDYQEVPHLRLKLAGDNNRVYDQPVIMYSTPARLSDPERFPREWAAFQRGEAIGNTGTLLVDWDRLEPGDIRRLEMQGISTVEGLAAVGDHQLTALGAGSRVLRDAAIAHVRAIPDPEKAALVGQVEKLSGIVDGLLGMLTAEQRAALGAAPADPVDQAAPAKRQRTNA